MRKINILLLGDGGTGKTSFANYIVARDPFSEKYVPTLGTEIVHVNTGLIDKVNCIIYKCFFKIYDTAGHDKFTGHISAPDADVIIITYSCKNRITHRSIQKWTQFARHDMMLHDVPILKVGTNYDYCTHETCGGCPWGKETLKIIDPEAINVSLKDGTNMHDLIRKINELCGQ